MTNRPQTSRRRGKKMLVWMTALLVAAIAANVVVYLARDKRDTYYPATYKALYVPADVPLLAGMRVVERGKVELQIRALEPPSRWKIADDTGETYTQDGPFPIVKLRDFKHGYEIEPLDGQAAGGKIIVHFGYYSSEYYKKGGRTQPDNYWMVSSSIPVGTFARRPLSYWASRFDDLDPADLEEARRIIKNEIGVMESDGTAAKIEKLGCWLITQWKGGSGTPSDQIEKEKSPLRIFKMVLNGQGRIWCSQHALIYHFFANMAGMPSRLVSLAGRVDNVITTGHAFAETFIPEQGGWAKVDLSTNNMLILNPEGRALASADVYNAIVTGNIEGLTARRCQDGAPASVPYTEVKDTDSYYYTPGSNLVFKPGRERPQSRLARYLIRPDWAYSLDLSALQRTYTKRRVLFLGTCGIAALWLVSLCGAVLGKRG